MDCSLEFDYMKK